MIMIGRWGTGENCGKRDNGQQQGRNRPTHTGATVSVTGFSVTLTVAVIEKGLFFPISLS